MARTKQKNYNDAFDEYFTKIYDGTIISSEYIKKLSEKLLNARHKPKNKYHFDIEKATRPINFIEAFCKQPTGTIGVPLSLELFQKARYMAVFGFVDDNGIRQYREVNIFEGRKNGKTTECAAIEIYLLVADNEGSPQIYNVATKLDQAKLGFDAAHNMIKQSDDLSSHIRKRKSDLYCDLNMGYIKALASRTQSLDGLDVHGAIIDELSAISNRDLYDLIKQGTSARKQPLLLAISTQGFLRGGVFDAQLEYARNVIDGKIKDDSYLGFIYELDSKDEWQNKNNWIKANPGLGTIKNIKALEDNVIKAKNDHQFMPTLMVKDFNLPETSSMAWLTYDTIHNPITIEADSFREKYYIGGFDLSETTDLTYAVALTNGEAGEIVYTHSRGFLPYNVLNNPNQTIRTERDKVPYKLWTEQGYIQSGGDYKNDPRCVLEFYKELRDKYNMLPLKIGYDPWHVDSSLIREFQAEFGKNVMVVVRQGVKTLSNPMKLLKAELEAKKVVYQNNPVLKWNLMNLGVKVDVNGNIQPIKVHSGINRIDGAVAMINAYVVYLDNKDTLKNLNEE